jgi:hypothetical protein
MLIILVHYTSFGAGRKIAGAWFQEQDARSLRDRGGRV